MNVFGGYFKTLVLAMQCICSDNEFCTFHFGIKEMMTGSSNLEMDINVIGVKQSRAF